MFFSMFLPFFRRMYPNVYVFFCTTVRPNSSYNILYSYCAIFFETFFGEDLSFQQLAKNSLPRQGKELSIFIQQICNKVIFFLHIYHKKSKDDIKSSWLHFFGLFLNNLIDNKFYARIENERKFIQ